MLETRRLRYLGSLLLIILVCDGIKYLGLNHPITHMLIVTMTGFLGVCGAYTIQRSSRFPCSESLATWVELIIVGYFTSMFLIVVAQISILLPFGSGITKHLTTTLVTSVIAVMMTGYLLMGAHTSK